METSVYVALGSNLGNREENIRAAIARLADLASGAVEQSSFYETEPLGMDAPLFINAVVGFHTHLSPEELLVALQGIEVDMGRPADHRENDSRTIDLDIICYGDLRIDAPNLELPHPRAHLRSFVLVPLAEIAPALVLPGQSKTAQELANGCRPAGRMIVISPRGSS
jgi:2-amino-4-hydroxy-6-hydroxymethyldihydropteridine diphosphokinase